MGLLLPGMLSLSGIIKLSNLNEKTVYEFYVHSSDKSKQMNRASTYGYKNSFTTKHKKIITVWKTKYIKVLWWKVPVVYFVFRTVIRKNPVDGSVYEEEINVATSTIEWGTNFESDSRVDYGLTEQYGESVYDGNFVTDHSVFIDNLEPGTIYHYMMTSAGPDSTDSLFVSPGLTFRTPDQLDIEPPAVVEQPYVSDKTKTGAVIEWGTDEDADSFVEYWNIEEPDKVMTGGTSDVSRKHKVTLTNLEPGKHYRYFISSTDVSLDQNKTKMEGTDSPFRTLDEEDTYPPVIITGPDVPIITNNSATIIWETSEPATSLLKFGVTGIDTLEEIRTPYYELQQKFDLSNLEPNTEYEYEVYSYDRADNETKSKQFKKFRTLLEEDTTPPVLIEGPMADFKDKTASFYWMTDEDANSFVFYKVAGSSASFVKNGSSDMVKEHSVIVTDLEPGTEYWFVVSSTDFNFNTMAVFPTDFTGDSTLFKSSRTLKVNQPPGGSGRFRTKRNADTQAPVIIKASTVSNITKSTATIKWTTNENSNSFINFGLTDDYGLSKGSAINITEHEITLTNLDSAATYNFQVASTDLSRNGPVLGKNAAFTTLDETDIIPPDIIEQPSVVSITDKEATVLWLTNEPADSYLEFGFDSTFGELDTLFGQTLSKSLPKDVEEHKITLTNLEKDTLYYYRVASTDIFENGPTYSITDTFRTSEEPDIAPPSIKDTLRIVSVSDKSITIEWGTNELSDSFIKYDSTAAVDKKIALRKAGQYVEDLFENTTGSPKDVTDHTVTVTDLEPGTDYSFRIGSIDKSNNEWLSKIASFSTTAQPDLTPPAKPQNLAIIQGSEKLMLTWSDNSESDLAAYNIYKFDGTDFVEVFSQVADTFYVDKGLENNSSYFYKITAVDKQSPPNESEFSDEKLGTPDASSVPDAPVIFSPADGFVLSSTSPALSVYNAKSPRNGLKYTFIVSTDSTFNTSIVVFQTGVEEGIERTMHNVASALADKTRYYWRTRAFDGYFYSDWMESAFFDIDMVTAVDLMSFEAFEAKGKVLLKWETASEKNNLGFNILKSNEEYGEFIQINEELITGNAEKLYQFTDNDIQLGNTYYYILQSVGIAGDIAEYQAVSVTLKVPDKYTLYQNYPNPFNPTTNVKFDLPRNEKVTLKIYNILGQEIRTLVNEDMEAGSHVILWNGRNNFGIKVASGVYIYQIRAGKYIKAKKMSFIK